MDASGAGGGGSLLFVKEEVKPISETATTSLLSSSLARCATSACFGLGVVVRVCNFLPPVDTSRPRNDAPVSSPMSQRVPMSPIKVDHTHRRAHRSREVFGDERKTASPGSAPVHSPAFHGLTPPASVYRAHRQRSRSVHAAPSGDVVPMTLAEDTGGFSVRSGVLVCGWLHVHEPAPQVSHVIQTIVSACKPVLDKVSCASSCFARYLQCTGSRLRVRSRQAPREYQLRISETEDSIIVDDDFPGLTAGCVPPRNGRHLMEWVPAQSWMAL